MKRKSLSKFLVLGGCLLLTGAFAMAQGLSGETSSGIHGSSNTPSQSNDENRNVRKLGQTINRPEDNAPQSPELVAPASAVDHDAHSDAKIDKLERYNELDQAEKQFSLESHDRLGRIADRITDLKGKADMAAPDLKSDLEARLAELNGKRDDIAQLINKAGKANPKNFENTKKQVTTAMNDLEVRVKKAEKDFSK